MHERILSNMISSITSVELERPTITLILTQCLIAILEEMHSELQALLFDLTLNTASLSHLFLVLCCISVLNLCARTKIFSEPLTLG